MLCDSCKNKEASIHYTNVINGEVQKIHLCEDCALSKDNLDGDFSFHKLLTGLIGSLHSDSIIEGFEKQEDIVCPKCGLTYSQFKDRGKFGCPDCYDAFKDKIIPILQGIHGHTSHIGKIPKRSKEYILINRDISKKRLELEDLIRTESFEEAAILRDEIKKLEDEVKFQRGDKNG